MAGGAPRPRLGLRRHYLDRFNVADEVAAGDVLFTVDLRPVVIGRGVVPAFRNLQAGDSGVDVEQLEAMLVELGFLSVQADDLFDAATTTAVRSWQASLGVTTDGSRSAGSDLCQISCRAQPTRSNHGLLDRALR